MRTLLAVPLLALLFAPPALADDDDEAPPKPVEERIRIANIVPFDVAACASDEIALGAPNAKSFQAVVTRAQPRALECLTAPEARKDAAVTEVRVTATLDDKGAKLTASGPNLTPKGAACVAARLQTALKIAPLPAEAEPVELVATFVHDPNVHPVAKRGINAPSDWTAAARVALPAWCACYEDFAATRPPVLTADVDLKAGVSQVVFREAPTPEAKALAQCLQPKLTSLPVPASETEFRFAYRIPHLHSGDLAPAADLGPELAFQQAELGRQRLHAVATLAVLDRAAAASVYDEAVAEYTKTKKYKLVKGLVSKCKDLVAADEAWIAAAKGLLGQEERMAAQTSDLAAKDASWKRAAEAMAAARDASVKEVETATGVLTTDKNACPKMR